MFYIVAFFTELFLLFATSYFLIPTLGHAFFKITKNRIISVHLLFYIFLPGILIHELSHALLAGTFMVPMGQIKLYPEITEKGVRFGSLEVAKTDFIRRFLIGIAPMITGIVLILGILYVVSSGVIIFPWSYSPQILNIILSYFIFTIVNTMLSSSKDLEGALGILISTLIILMAIYFSGIHLSFNFLEKFIPVFKTADTYLIWPILANGLLVISGKILLRRF